jgi:hypothetical protein
MEKITSYHDLEKSGFSPQGRYWDNVKEAVLDCYIYSICSIRMTPEFTLHFLSRKLESVSHLNLNAINEIVDLLDKQAKDESNEFEAQISEKFDKSDYSNEIKIFTDAFDSLEMISEELNTKITIVEVSKTHEISKEKHFNSILTNIYLRQNIYEVLTVEQPRLQLPQQPKILQLLVISINKLINNNQALKTLKSPNIEEINKLLIGIKSRYNLPLDTEMFAKFFLNSSIILSNDEKLDPVILEQDSSISGTPSNTSLNNYNLPQILKPSKISDFFNKLDFK